MIHIEMRGIQVAAQGLTPRPARKDFAERRVSLRSRRAFAGLASDARC